MKDKLWFVPPGSKELKSPYETDFAAKRIGSADPITVTLRSAMVAEDLEGLFRGDNDILILTSASLGERPLVQRVHYYEEEVPPKTVLKNFIAETMFIWDDYSGMDRLWLEVDIMEIDTDTGERNALVNALTSLAATAGAAFPAVVPYTMAASGIAAAIERLISALEKNVPVVKCPMAFYPPPRSGAPLQTGSYVVFANPVDGSKYRLHSNQELESKSGSAPDKSYVVFTIETVKADSPQWLISQRVATLLTQLDKGNPNTPAASIDFLNDTLKQYCNFLDLKRYLELKRKDPNVLRQAEKDLLDRIARREDLLPFLPK
jgi:hypothetical protein